MDARQDAPAHTAHPRLAAMLVWLGLLGAFGGGSFEVVRDGFLGNGVDWGTLNACLTFGILLAAFGECWAHAPTSATACVLMGEHRPRQAEPVNARRTERPR